MDGSVLALFDPIYDEQLAHGVSSRPTGALPSARNMAKDLSSTQGVPGDASVASNQAQLTQTIGSLELHPSKQVPHRSVPQSSRTHSQDAMYHSQAPYARSKPNPFGLRRLPAATAPRQSDRNLALRTSALLHQQHAFTARSVSLPTTLTSHDRFTHTAGRSRAAMLGAIHTNRVVSLPEAAVLNNHLSGAVHSHFSTLPTVDELHPLIDLTSPPRRTSVDPTTSQPATVPAHFSFSNQSENRPSPPSSPELSETDIVVGSPTTGRSVHFLRHNLAPSTTNTDSSYHSSMAPSAAKPATFQTEAQTAKPIPALHGPPSLPYARCPSGAEGIMISEQASLPRMIWGLHEQSPTAPKTPGIRRAPLSEQPPTNSAASGPPQDATAMDTPASTLVVTPESAKFGTIWQHPKLSYTSSAPYLKFKRSMQAGSRVGPLQSNTDPSLVTHTDGPMKLGPPFRGKENAPLGSPFLPGSGQFETPGGYTEYHYVDEDHSNPLWREFVPASHRDVSESATLSSNHSAVPPSLRSASLDATATRTYDRINTDTNLNIEEENLNQSQVVDALHKAPGLAPFGSIPSAPRQAPEPPASSIPSSTDSISTQPIFAVRKTPRSQLHRPKLRDHPALAELLSNQTLYTGIDNHTDLTNPISSDIRQLALSLSVAPEALLDSLQKLRTQKFAESPDNHVNGSLPFASIAAPSSNAYVPANSLDEPALPPGIKIPDHLLTPGTRASIVVSPSNTRDEKPLHPSGALRNPRSIPLARLRHKNQHKFSRTADSTDSPAPNDLAAGSPPSPIANASSDNQERENDVETAGVVQDVAGGRLVMGAGIQAQGPPIHSGFAAKTKKQITVDDVRNAPKESFAVSAAQANLSRRGNRGFTSTARPHPGKNSTQARSSGTLSDSNTPPVRHGRPKKAGSRPRTKTDNTNKKATAPVESAHPTYTPSLTPAP